MKELLEAGVHFGHQTRRWHPKMRRYIFGEREGIHIIDLLQTVDRLERARAFAQDLASKGGLILFVGTKKQAKDVVKEVAEEAGMLHVNERWLGGLLTNFNTIRKRIQRLHDLRRLKTEGQLDLLPTKERMSMEAELEKLETNLSGVAAMERLPDAVFVTDLKVEEIGVREANRLDITTIGLVDTNCDPELVDYVIPGNDDAIRSCQLVIGTIGTAVEEGAGAWRVQEERRIAEEMERRKKEEEERKKREEEEKERVAAEEAKKKAEEEAAAKKAAEAPPQAPQAPASQAAGPVGAGNPPPPPVAKASSGEVPPAPPPAAGAPQKDAKGSADSGKAPAAEEAPASKEKAPADAPKEGEAK